MLRIFDGHDDAVQRIQEFRPGGIDFLARCADGHLDLPRATEAGLGGGLFAMFVGPETATADRPTVTDGGGGMPGAPT